MPQTRSTSIAEPRANRIAAKRSVWVAATRRKTIKEEKKRTLLLLPRAGRRRVVRRCCCRCRGLVDKRQDFVGHARALRLPLAAAMALAGLLSSSA
jgi:hypothetical protein